VWEENWSVRGSLASRENPFIALTPSNGHVEELVVSDLINREGKCWDKDIISNILSPNGI